MPQVHENEFDDDDEEEGEDLLSGMLEFDDPEAFDDEDGLDDFDDDED